MLVLSRKTRDAIVIGQDIRVMVLSIGRDQVRLGIQAPPDVDVHREEVFLAIQEANRQAGASPGEGVSVAPSAADEDKKR
jgi:carbon storage regulator